MDTVPAAAVDQGGPGDRTRDVTGYLHAGYAASLAEHGVPRALPRSGAWVLDRAIPGSARRDAMGCYPLFCCADWSGLAGDLEDLRDPVTLTVVTDPFGAYESRDLERCFPELVRPFKRHFVVDLEGDPERAFASHHRRNARRALQRVVVARCDPAWEQLDDWVELYAALVRRHGIRGLAAFSRTAFAAQLRVPGAVLFRASAGGRSVGMTMWYVQGEVGYYHLGAYDEAGYAAGASFALFLHAILHFAERGLRALGLGAGAGAAGDEGDGLSRFKRGWATGTRVAYLCGRVFDRDAYAALAARGDRSAAARRRPGGGTAGITTADYFPLYRAGEFV
jgi:hypothetical protein